MIASQVIQHDTVMIASQVIQHDTVPFLSYLEDEVHYALRRQGYEWDVDHFEGVDENKYREIVDRVLEALAKNAVDFFKEEQSNPKTKRNLRVPLEPWF